MAPEIDGTCVLVRLRAEEHLTGRTGRRLADARIVQRLAREFAGSLKHGTLLHAAHSVFKGPSIPGPRSHATMRIGDTEHSPKNISPFCTSPGRLS